MTMRDSTSALSAARRAAERGVQQTWLYTLASIIVFVLVVDTVVLFRGLAALTASGSSLDMVIVASVLIAMIVQVRYCWFLRVGLGGGLPRPTWTALLIATAVPALVLGVFSPALWTVSAFPLWVAAVLISALVSGRARWAILAAGLACLVVAHAAARAVLSDIARIDVTVGIGVLLIYAAFLPAAVLFSLWWWNIVVELDKHRRSAGELAIAKERLRFAADLHDIQGHHLQVIALKSELAERMLERDPAAAREQLRETRAVAADALRETRSLVAGYRDVALDNELENAREVLTAAGIACTLRLTSLPASGATRRALAYVVREATTNILRHSQAENVSVTLSTAGGCSTLTVANDGVAAHAGSAGTGLDGLRARVAERGGSLTTNQNAERFELAVTIPDDAAPADERGADG